MGTTSYVIALGSNRPGRFGTPERQIVAALEAIGGVVLASRIYGTAPLGHSKRRFANAAALIETQEDPPMLLRRLKAIERHFGRRRGRSWSARVLDLDIILWSQGAWGEAGLTIPHAHFRKRAFVLDPLVRIVPDWRDPITGRTVRQLRARLTRRALVRSGGGVGP